MKMTKRSVLYEVPKFRVRCISGLKWPLLLLNAIHGSPLDRMIWEKIGCVEGGGGGQCSSIKPLECKKNIVIQLHLVLSDITRETNRNEPRKDVLAIL